MFKINIPDEVKWIINELNILDYKAYIVGGCVRDSLLGREPKDWDICTDANPDLVADIFRNHGLAVIETGLQHGTVTIHFSSGNNYEITTFRTESEYSDNRHPDKVEFVDDLTADLARRDFTINAMAYNDTEGLIDPYGGQEDLKNGIRCVGHPDDRFREDALRIMRAIRFSSTYGLVIDHNTELAMLKNFKLLNYISAERIRDELCKTLVGTNSRICLIRYWLIITEIIRELLPCVRFNQNNQYHEFDVYEHICKSVGAYTGNDITIKMALLLHDIGKPECYTENETGGHFYGHPAVSHRIAEYILSRLKFDNKTRDAILELVLYHDVEIKPSKRVARRLLNKLGTERVRQLIEVRKADILGQTNHIQSTRLYAVDEFATIVEDIVADQECFKVKDLAVNGHDILNLGVEGITVGKVLNHLLDKVIDEEITNDRYELLYEAEKYLKFLKGE